MKIDIVQVNKFSYDLIKFSQGANWWKHQYMNFRR